MSRTQKNRNIQRAPSYSGFKPFGTQKNNKSAVKLGFEEYEAMKLCDYDDLKHEEAAKIMKVSRPTFTRIYQNARKKLAKALVEASMICIEGGNVVIGLAWYHCSECEISFSIIAGNEKRCPLCGNTDLKENN